MANPDANFPFLAALQALALTHGMNEPIYIVYIRYSYTLHDLCQQRKYATLCICCPTWTSENTGFLETASCSDGDQCLL